MYRTELFVFSRFSCFPSHWADHAKIAPTSAFILLGQLTMPTLDTWLEWEWQWNDGWIRTIHGGTPTAIWLNAVLATGACFNESLDILHRPPVLLQLPTFPEPVIFCRLGLLYLSYCLFSFLFSLPFGYDVFGNSVGQIAEFRERHGWWAWMKDVKTRFLV